MKVKIKAPQFEDLGFHTFILRCIKEGIKVTCSKRGIYTLVGEKKIIQKVANIELRRINKYLKRNK